MGFLTSRDPDIPEGLERRLSVRICRIPAEFLHLTELELKKLCLSLNGFWQSFHARATPRTPNKPGSPPAHRTLPLSLLYKE
jgi:hypothetical protein